MKKLFGLALTLTLILAWTGAAMASLFVDGDVQYVYQFEKEKSDNTGDMNNSIDMIYGNWGMKYTVNDSVSYKMVMKYDGWKQSGNTPLLYFYEIYTDLKTKNAGDFRIGQYEYKPYYNQVLTQKNSVLGILDSPVMIGWTSPKYFNNLTIGALYIPDFQMGSNFSATANASEPIGFGSWAFSAGYETPKWGIKYYLVSLGTYDRESNGEQKYWNPSPVSVINAYYNTPVDGLKVILNYGKEQDQIYRAADANHPQAGLYDDNDITHNIVGLHYTKGPWTIFLEQNFKYDGIDYLNTDGDFFPWGYTVRYRFNNSLTSEFSQLHESDTADVRTQLKMKLYFK